MSYVILITPIGQEDPGLESYASPHHGLHKIAGYLRYRGHCVEVWDHWYSDLSLEQVLKKRPWELIGFSTISHTLPQDLEAMQTARTLCPLATILVGGMEAAMNFQEIFDHAPVDGVVLAEGEYVLAEYLEHPERIPRGMILRRLARPFTAENLWDTYQHMDFSQMNYPRYWEQIRRVTGNPDHEPEIRLVTETHCNRNCVFCSQTNFHRRATGRIQPPALLSAEQIYELVGRAKTQLPDIKKVYFDGDDFLLEKERAISYFSRYAQSGPLQGMKYLTEAGLPHIDEECVRVMAEGGLILLNMGLENCSQRVLKSLGKPQSVEKCFQVVEWCRAYGVEPYVLIILFPPESTLEDLRLNVTTLTRLMDQGATLSIIPLMRPYRGVRMYEMDYDFLWETVPIPGGGALKRPTIVWCKDPEARRVQERFIERWSSRIEAIKREQGNAFRRRTAPEMVALLRELLEEIA